MNNKYLITTIIILIVLLGAREYINYSDSESMKKSYKSIIAFKDGEKKQLKNSLELKVADEFIMKQNIVSSKIAQEQLRGEVERFKEISSYVKMESITAIRNIEAKYNDDNIDDLKEIPVINSKYVLKEDIEKYFVRVNKSFKHENDSGWFYISGLIKKESVLIDSMSVFNKFDATIGIKKSDKNFSWLRKGEPVVYLKSYNPYSKIVYVNNITVENDKSKVGNILFSKPAMIIYGILGGKLFLN